MTVDNYLYLLLALIPALLNLGILAYLFFFVPRGKTINIFSFFLLALIMWQSEDTAMRLISTEDQARYVDRMLCLGWQAFAPLAFHFACRYARVKLFSRSYGLFLIYLPFVVLYLIYLGSSDHTVFQHRGPWGWLNTPRDEEADSIHRLLIGAYTCAAVYILFRYAYQLKDSRQKQLQASIIAVGILIPAIQGLTTQIVFPVMLHIPEIPVTSSFMTFFSLATIVAIRLFGLFNIAEAVEVESILESLTSIVFVVSPKKRIIYMNPWAADTLVKGEESKSNFSVSKIFSSPDYFERFKTEVFDKCFQERAVSNFTTCFKTSDGNTIHVVLSAELIQKNGLVQGMLVVANDVTRLQQSIKELERSNAQLEQYAHAASHDLQEPLRKIIFFLNLLLENQGGEKGDEAHKYIHKAINSASSMRLIVQDLLEVANVTAMKPKQESVDTNEAVNAVLHTLQDELQEAGATVEVGELPVINGCNNALVQQLFRNLVGNALKYRSERPLFIKITASDSQDKWQFSVSDTGIGIAEEYHEQIFGFFKRLHSKQTHQGTGVGLSICKKIVEQYGGRIWVESQEGAGSTFHFTMPKQ